MAVKKKKTYIDYSNEKPGVFSNNVNFFFTGESIELSEIQVLVKLI